LIESHPRSLFGLVAEDISVFQAQSSMHVVFEQPQKLDLLIAQTPTLGDPTSIPAAS